MARLSVNVNKVATLRNSRGSNVPCLEDVTGDIIRFGAKGITVHPRPDERHIKRADVFVLKKRIHDINKKYGDKKFHLFVEFNIEGFPSPAFLKLIERVKPSQCTLVPDPPGVLTSNQGWSLFKNLSFLKRKVKKLRELQVRSSLFLDPLTFLKSSVEKKSLLDICPDRVEIYTGKYAQFFYTSKRDSILRTYKKFEDFIHENSSIEINAGHDLNQKNLKPLLQSIPSIKEVSIGHALICEALYDGFKKTLRHYLKICKD